MLPLRINMRTILVNKLQTPTLQNVYEEKYQNVTSGNGTPVADVVAHIDTHYTTELMTK